MASSGSFSGSIHSGHYVLRVDWTQTKNVSVNTSTITAKAYLVNDWSLSINARSDNKVTIDGTAQTYASPAISSTGTHLLGTVTQTVNHGSDGTKSLAMSAVFYIRATLSGTYYESITASANITLDSIARASTVSASNVEMGSATTIAISRASSSFTHTLTYAFGSATGTIATKTTSTSVSWTPPLMLAGQIPKAVTGTGTITCTTYNGNTSIGSKTCTLTLTVPASVKPTITSLTAARVDGAVPSTWGIYVQTKSKATLTINGAAGSYGSTISSYSITGGGYTSTASSFTTGFLNTSGTVTFTATVTDSRGRVSAAATVSISVVAYSPPSFASYLSQRCLSSGTANDDGTYIRGQVSYSYTSCSSKNTITRATYYKKASDTAWTNAGASFSSGTAFTFGGGNISTKTSYDIKYTLTDTYALPIEPQYLKKSFRDIKDRLYADIGTANGRLDQKQFDAPPIESVYEMFAFPYHVIGITQQEDEQLSAAETWPLVASSLSYSGTLGPYWYFVRKTVDLGQLESYINRAAKYAGKTLKNGIKEFKPYIEKMRKEIPLSKNEKQIAVLLSEYEKSGEKKKRLIDLSEKYIGKEKQLCQEAQDDLQKLMEEN